MKYFSLNRQSPAVSFEEAVVRGLAPDNGLYFPESIPALPKAFFDEIETFSNVEIGFAALHPFVGDEIPEADLRRIITETLAFEFPVVPIEQDVYTLELFHGPTMAFKDVGARFMARCLGYFNQGKPTQNTVLVATSGDTGGAVASGFLGVDGVDVVILYPSGKVSNIQEKQLTTFGQNITALEVAGTFDDCQAMVKRAFLDDSLTHKHLTSANSINVARWLPQMLYFFFAYRELKKHGKPLVVSCPSGNFGNICAGIIAKKMGLPLERFVASTNVNDTVPRFLQNWLYDPKPSLATISNAMDVGNPSNFVRIREMYQDNPEAFAQDFAAYAFSDDQTLAAMQQVFTRTGYMMEPHGAVGYLGLKKEMEKHPGCTGVFLETAHPVKFSDTVDDILGTVPQIPAQIVAILHKEKHSIAIADYDDLHRFLTR